MRKWVVFVGVLLAVGVGAGIAVAVVVPTLFADTNVVREKVLRSAFTPSADQPRLDVPWHTHPGPVIVQVQEGKLTLFQHCRVFVLHPGDTYIETPEVPVSARARRAVTWTSTFILPNSAPGSPDRTPAAAPACPGSDD